MVRTQLGMPEVLRANRRIRQYLQPTPLIPSPYLSEQTGAEVWLKLECLQPTHSFKVRGALNKLTRIREEGGEKGLVTGSAGNHGLGVAFAAAQLGFSEVEIFVPENAPVTKLDRLSRYRVNVHLAGPTYEEAHQAALAFSKQTGAEYIHAYDDVDIIAGQGTVGLEVITALPEADILLVPIGGGGLIAGIATTAKELSPGIEVIGVQPAASPAALLSLQDGVPYDPYDHEPTIADGLAGGFGKIPFLLARTLIDEIVLAEEKELRSAIFHLLDKEQLVVEPAGAAAITPLLAGSSRFSDKRIVAVLSGGNLDTDLLRSILSE